MSDSAITITQGVGTNVDTRTISGGDHRQVVVLGDGTNTDVGIVRSADPNTNDAGLVVRDVNTSAIVAKLTSGVAVTSASTLAVYFDRGNPAVTAYGSQANVPLQTNT